MNDRRGSADCRDGTGLVDQKLDHLGKGRERSAHLLLLERRASRRIVRTLGMLLRDCWLGGIS